MLGASATAPTVAPLEMIPAKVVAPELPVTIVFLTVLLVAAFAGEAILANHTTVLDVPVLVLAIVKLRDVVPLLLPSIMILSAPFNLIIAAAFEPVIVAVLPLAGTIVNVLAPA